MQKQIYIILSQTGTLLSRLLSIFTGAEYNHASIGLTPDLKRMYSFGRLRPYNPFLGGFVTESPYSGTFGRFYKTKVVVLAVNVSDETYVRISRQLGMMSSRSRRYRYNYVGLGLAAFNISHSCRDRYYCSEFVKYILQEYNVRGAERLGDIVQPIHLLAIPNSHLVFRGRLRDYAEECEPLRCTYK